MDARLPAHLEVGGLLRAAEAAGGFGMVLRKGERDAGTILLVTITRGHGAQLWERMPQLDGARKFTCTMKEDTEKQDVFSEYLERRMSRDPDGWFVELTIDDSERFIASLQR